MPTEPRFWAETLRTYSDRIIESPMTRRMQGWTKIILGIVIILFGAAVARAIDLDSGRMVGFLPKGFIASTLYGQLVLGTVCLGILLTAFGTVAVCKKERPIWLLVPGFITGGVLLWLAKPLLYGSLVIVHGTGAMVLLAWPCLAIVAITFLFVGLVRLIKSRRSPGGTTSLFGGGPFLD